jgi:hypothetical protein
LILHESEVKAWKLFYLKGSDRRDFFAARSKHQSIAASTRAKVQATLGKKTFQARLATSNFLKFDRHVHLADRFERCFQTYLPESKTYYHAEKRYQEETEKKRHESYATGVPYVEDPGDKEPLLPWTQDEELNPIPKNEKQLKKWTNRDTYYAWFYGWIFAVLFRYAQLHRDHQALSRLYMLYMGPYSEGGAGRIGDTVYTFEKLSLFVKSWAPNSIPKSMRVLLHLERKYRMSMNIVKDVNALLEPDKDDIHTYVKQAYASVHSTTDGAFKTTYQYIKRLTQNQQKRYADYRRKMRKLLHRADKDEKSLKSQRLRKEKPFIMGILLPLQFHEKSQPSLYRITIDNECFSPEFRDTSLIVRENVGGSKNYAKRDVAVLDKDGKLHFRTHNTMVGKALLDLFAYLNVDFGTRIMELGRKFGFCCSCGRLLKDKQSLERGLGSDCWRYFGNLLQAPMPTLDSSSSSSSSLNPSEDSVASKPNKRRGGDDLVSLSKKIRMELDQMDEGEEEGEEDEEDEEEKSIGSGSDEDDESDEKSDKRDSDSDSDEEADGSDTTSDSDSSNSTSSSSSNSGSSSSSSSKKSNFSSSSESDD